MHLQSTASYFLSLLLTILLHTILIPPMLVHLSIITNDAVHYSYSFSFQTQNPKPTFSTNSYHHEDKGKGNRTFVYLLVVRTSPLRRTGVDHTVLPESTPHLPLLRSSPEGATTEWTVIASADEAYYSLIDPVMMKGWVGHATQPMAVLPSPTLDCSTVLCQFSFHYPFSSIRAVRRLNWIPLSFWSHIKYFLLDHLRFEPKRRMTFLKHDANNLRISHHYHLSCMQEILAVCHQ